MNDKVDSLMVDSGAYTVWTQGTKIDLDTYIKWCKKQGDLLDIIVALDVIPAIIGSNKPPSKKHINNACEEGWDNYMRMLDAGLPKEKVVPVFHLGDDWKWLERFIKEKVPYFGFGGFSNLPSNRRRQWLDECMKIVCDKKGMPLAKFHGFAVTSIPLMVRYPWFSCDSTSWIMNGIRGCIIVPYRKNNTWQFLKPPRVINFSTRAGEQSSKRGKHYKYLSPEYQKVVRSYVEMMGFKIGKSRYRKEDKKYKHDSINENIFARKKDHLVIEEKVEHGLCNDDTYRCMINQHFFLKVSEYLTWPRPFIQRKRGLF